MTNEVSGTTDTIIRITAIAVLVAACFVIISPFLAPFVWGVIIAVAASGFYSRLLIALAGRTKAASAVFAFIGIATVVIPAILLSETLVGGARTVASHLADGTLQVPTPPETVAEWPLVGSSLYPIWLLASENLQAAVAELAPHLKELSRPLLAAAGSVGFAVIQLVVSIAIATVFLANGDAAALFAERLATRVAGARGRDLAALSRATVSSVAIGILGVAVIQSVLAGIGFVVAGVPGAGLWALMVLIAAIVQLPVAILMIPLVVYVVTTASTGVAIGFAVWCTFVSLIDNVLKPILFAKGGANVPVLVIFLGSIGGLFAAGLVGLFVGPVILAVGYEVMNVWLDDTPAGG